jgi:hypothetical protein
MAIQTINIGNAVNDGLGDDLRTAFQKVNANFADLNSQQSITGQNLNTATGVGIFKQKVGTNLQFKSLVSDGKITLTPSNDYITVGTVQKDGFSSITTNSGSITANVTTAYDQITIQGGANINVTASQRTITVDTKQNIGFILNDADLGTIGSGTDNLITFLLQVTDIDFGTIDQPAGIEYDAGTI